MKATRFWSALRIVVGVVGVLAAFALARLLAEPVSDWLALRSYAPPPAIAELANQTTMSDEGRRLFYINKPEILDRQTFNARCPMRTEKTIVLGCYHAVQRGIFIFSVKDKELQGVEHVTAAHEMLHAAYDRLSRQERQKVDAMLLDYYHHELEDTRIHAVIESYKASEPDDVVNEMHSIFGTEVMKLPVELEAYYHRYFEERVQVVKFAEQYRGAFTRRQAKIEAYDTQLAELEQQIHHNEQLLSQQGEALAGDQPEVAARNDQASIDAYNQRVASYNLLLEQTNGLIDRYNDIAAARNTIALEEKQLQQLLDSSVSPE